MRGGMRLTPAQMLDDAYLAERAKLIDPKRAQRFSHGHAPRGGTIYLTAADERGMMVSFIQSNYMGFGSGVVVPGWGVSMQNRGHGFSLDPKSPNVVAPGKRPFHTIIPAFLTKDGRPQMSFGVMGGNMQPQGHLQTLVRMLAHGQQPQTACDAPRWRFNQGLEINVEAAMPTGDGRRACSSAATRRRSSTTATRTSVPASSSGGSAIRRSRATSPPATRGATARPPATERAPMRTEAVAAESRRAKAAAPAAGAGRALAGAGAGDGRLDRLLRQGDHRQARLPVRRRRGHAHHVPDAVRAAAVRAARLVGGARQAGADAARLAGGLGARLFRLLPRQLPRLRRPAVHHRQPRAADPLSQPDPGAGDRRAVPQAPGRRRGS